jgi:hypothetical protein
VRELAMRAVLLSPLLEQAQDLFDLIIEQPVHRMPARLAVIKRTGPPAVHPPVSANPVQLQHPADLVQRPTRTDGVLDEIEQPFLGDRIHTAWNPATQPQGITRHPLPRT